MGFLFIDVCFFVEEFFFSTGGFFKTLVVFLTGGFRFENGGFVEKHIFSWCVLKVFFLNGGFFM